LTLPPLEFLIVAAGLLGLIVGSYLNVVIHRLPAGESTVLPASHCPKCGATIRALDNLPLVSWLALGGRCRACKAPISPRYPLVELAAGLAFAGAVARFGPSRRAVVAALFSALLVALAGIDFEHYLLPDRITLPGIALGLAAQLALPDGSLAKGVAGALVGAGLLLVVAGAWELARGVEGMGLGDVKMLAMVGALVGAAGVVVTLLLGTLLGSLAGLELLATRRGDFATKLPFGLFLAAGGLVAIFAGDALVAFYLGRAT
jgi:leader peptidase (prepilin peptidase)/N-methyltransferase